MRRGRPARVPAAAHGRTPPALRRAALPCLAMLVDPRVINQPRTRVINQPRSLCPGIVRAPVPSCPAPPLFGRGRAPRRRPQQAANRGGGLRGSGRSRPGPDSGDPAWEPARPGRASALPCTELRAESAGPATVRPRLALPANAGPPPRLCRRHGGVTHRLPAAERRPRPARRRARRASRRIEARPPIPTFCLSRRFRKACRPAFVSQDVDRL